jgi:hypothetical protein
MWLLFILYFALLLIAAGCRLPATECRLPATECRLPDADYRMQTIGFNLQLLLLTTYNITMVKVCYDYAIEVCLILIS